jgi:hypothetical protein
LTSHPAKRRFATMIDGIAYRATVLLTKDPGKLEKLE